MVKLYTLDAVFNDLCGRHSLEKLSTQALETTGSQGCGQLAHLGDIGFLQPESHVGLAEKANPWGVGFVI